MAGSAKPHQVLVDAVSVKFRVGQKVAGDYLVAEPKDRFWNGALVNGPHADAVESVNVIGVGYLSQ